MSYQTNLDFSLEKASHSAPQIQEEKKSLRKASHSKLTVTVNPLLSLKHAQPDPTPLQKIDEDQSPGRVVKKDQSPGKQVKTVTQAFGKVHPASKRSVGGTSLQPILPHSKSAHFSLHTKTEDKVSQLTPRIKEPKTPRTTSIASHTFTPTLPSSLEDIEKGVQHLSEFTHLFDEQIKLIQQVLQTSDKQVDDAEEPEEGQVDLAYQMLSNGLSEEWKALRRELNALLLEQEESDSLEDIEENVGSRSINLHNLGLDYQLDDESTQTTSGKTSLTKASLSLAKKSLKEEKHLKVAFELMLHLLLDLQVKDPWSQKDNLKKILQFIPSGFKIDKTSPTLPFNYINQLFFLGEILKQGSHNIDKLPKGTHPLTQLPIEHALKFLKALRDIREIKKLDKDSRKEKLDLYCHQYGDTITKYAKILLKSFIAYIEESEIMKSEAPYNLSLASQVSASMSQAPLKDCPGFANDFDRAYHGKFLHLASDRAECKIPRIKKKSDEQKFNKYCRDFLSFLKENLKIESESDPVSGFNPFEELQTQSLATVYFKLEEKWTQLSKGNPTPKFEGIFKLLPILRTFNQTILLSIHRAMTNMQKIVGALDPVLLINTHPEHQDWENKSIEITFKNNRVYLAFKRLNFLCYAPHRSEFQDCYFGEYPVKSTLVLSASTDNVEQWTVEEQSISIDRPAEISDPLILQRYSVMITILETMGIQYSINIK